MSWRRVQILVWEIWARNRRSVWLVVGIILFAWLLNAVLPAAYHATEAGRKRLLTLNCVLMTISLGFVFAIFTYSETDSQSELRGFPGRLFTLPIPTWLLAFLPICLGVLSLEVVYTAWLKLVFVRGELAPAGWLGVVLGTSLVFYLTILWGLAAFRISRIVALGLVGILCLWTSFLPGFGAWLPSPWLSQRRLIPTLVLVGIAAALTAWIAVAGQRMGATGNRKWLKNLLDRVADILPRQRKRFVSPARAQFWFEWRRSGLLLPACVAAAVILIVLPISWVLRHDHAGTLWVLAWTIAMPMLLAVPIGKGFSKPDFWSRDLSLPSFVAVRPFATGDVLVTKLKVAAVSASAAWLVVLFFLVFWLPLWADLSDLTMIRVGFWMVYHSIAPQYAIAALGLLAGLLLTWKFLVGGLWVGLSGSSRLFLGSGAAYCASGILAMVGLGILSNYADTHKHEPPDWNRWLAVLQWIAASAVILKFLLAAFSWRSISRQKTRWYLLGWIFSCLALVVFGILLWADGMLASLLDECPMDATRLQCFLLLLSLLLIPLGRIGLGPQSLAKNRHGAEKQSKYGVSRRRPSPMNKEVSLLGALVSILALFLAAGGRDFQRVDAGGHPVRILKIGSSGPTVVFEAGAGSSLETWVRVQRQVGKFANAISYDRAGNGASPRGPTPRDGRQVASELHAMLHNADAAPPYILVGHSLGGPYVRVFAGMYPDEVAGIVLVDPTQEKLIDWAKEREPKPAAGEPRPWDEVDCAPLTFKQAQESHIAPGVPVVLLSGTGPREVPGFAPPELKREVLQDQRELYPAKLKFHREWVEKLPRGRLVATENSGHGIPWEEPELIVETVRQVVKEARLNPGPVLSRGR